MSRCSIKLLNQDPPSAKTKSVKSVEKEKQANAPVKNR